MKKISLRALIFILWIFGFAAAFLLYPDKSFSEMENRYLQTLPEFSAARLFSGAYGKEFEDYLNDQFVLRDGFVKLNTTIRYASGLREKNDVYYTTDGALIQKANEPERIERNAQAAADFAAKCDVPVYFALIPGALELRADTLPEGAPGQDQGALIQKACDAFGNGAVDMLGALSGHDDEKIFYRTDHHWTSLGAYYGYTAIMKSMGLQAQSSGEPVTLSNNFYGTLYSKAPAFWIKPDSIERYVPADGTRVTAYEGEEAEQRALYCMENLAKKDKYTVFLGGNKPRVVVETQNTHAPRLLILRDSYTDAMTPFLTRHFSRIDLLDCRYYRRSVSAYINENDIDMVLICYSVANFCSDANLALALAVS